VSNSTTGKPATSMADLMKSVKTSFIVPKKGENLEGIITKVTSSEITVDIGAKTEAIVLEKDRRLLKNLLTQIKVGDKVKVTVLNPESDMGNSVVSLRRFIDDRIWIDIESLKNQKKEVEVTIDDITKGGFLVSTQDGILGFLPNSQTQFLDVGQTQIGKKVLASLLETNRQANKIIFSQKTTMDRQTFEKETSELRIDQKIYARITNIATFGLFLTLQGKENSLEGFIHLSEVSWDKLDTVPPEYKVGDQIETKIIGFDKKTFKVNLSIRQLTADPFESEMEKFVVDAKVTGKIIKVLSSGVILSLGENIDGFIKKEKIPPTMNFNEGAEVIATVSEVDKKKRRVVLIPVLKEKPMGYR
jgi:small subunit ribosomal protein S1